MKKAPICPPKNYDPWPDVVSRMYAAEMTTDERQCHRAMKRVLAACSRPTTKRLLSKLNHRRELEP